MSPASFPSVGSQARRKVDGILGEVYLSDPQHNQLSVRWPTIPGAWGTQDLTPDQFASSWELTGVQFATPRETGFALGLIAVLVVVVFSAILIHDYRYRYLGYDPGAAQTADPAAVLGDAQALDHKYGLEAAIQCAAGADEYIRSVARHRFHWADTGMLEPRFDGFNAEVAAAGVLTMTSGKAFVSNGFGVFSPIKVYCNYDTQSHEVLSYMVEGLGQ